MKRIFILMLSVVVVLFGITISNATTDSKKPNLEYVLPLEHTLMFKQKQEQHTTPKTERKTVNLPKRAIRSIATIGDWLNVHLFT